MLNRFDLIVAPTLTPPEVGRKTTEITAQQHQTTSNDFILNLEKWSEFEITWKLLSVLGLMENTSWKVSFSRQIHPTSPAGEEPVEAFGQGEAEV